MIRQAFFLWLIFISSKIFAVERPSSALLHTVELSWSRVDMLRMNGHRNHRAWAQLRCQITELSVNQNGPLIVDAQKRKSDNWISAAYRSTYTYIYIYQCSNYETINNHSTHHRSPRHLMRRGLSIVDFEITIVSRNVRKVTIFCVYKSDRFFYSNPI